MKQLIIGAVAVAILGLLAVFGLHVAKAPSDSSGDKPSVGSVTSPDIASPYLTWGSVPVWKAKVTMRTATTTLCAIQAPAATSTLQSFAAQVTTGTSTAATITLATSTNPYATTTAGSLLLAQSVASGALATFSYDPVSNTNVVAPNAYVIFKTEGAGLGGYTFGGTCQAQFEQVSA